MKLFYENPIFETVKSKVIISLFEIVRLSVSISPRNLYTSLKSIKDFFFLFRKTTTSFHTISYYRWFGGLGFNASFVFVRICSLMKSSQSRTLPIIQREGVVPLFTIKS